jgi:hypothetical protein
MHQFLYYEGFQWLFKSTVYKSEQQLNADGLSHKLGDCWSPTLAGVTVEQEAP